MGRSSPQTYIDPKKVYYGQCKKGRMMGVIFIASAQCALVLFELRLMTQPVSGVQVVERGVQLVGSKLKIVRGENEGKKRGNTCNRLLMVLKSTIAKTKILVINEGHRLRATTTEGQNTFASSLCFG